VTSRIQTTSSENDAILDPIIGLLACPECHGDLARRGTGLTCLDCHREYDVKEGIPLLARLGSAEQWNAASDG
jgi:hypothetical protein